MNTNKARRCWATKYKETISANVSTTVRVETFLPSLTSKGTFNLKNYNNIKLLI